MIEEVLEFSAWLMTAAMMISLAVWFCGSAMTGVIEIRQRRHQNSRRNAFLKENARLKQMLADVEQENAHLRKQLYYSDSGRNRRRRSYDVSHHAA